VTGPAVRRFSLAGWHRGAGEAVYWLVWGLLINETWKFHRLPSRGPVLAGPGIWAVIGNLSPAAG
jgi:hypothetical protein